MCGVLFTKNITEDLFRKSLDLMDYRGPNATGVFKHSNVLLGHKRLSIVDLDNRSSQPFLASDGKTYIIFNGEVYNFKELKEEFKIETTTTSDTEVIVEMYLKFGKECLKHFNGMFSIIIYNTETQDTFVARDRLGIKPLYVYEKNETLIYSSEINAILEMVEKPTYDMIGIRQYLKLRTFFRGHTLYKEIKMFPAGHLSINGKIEQYWNLEDFKDNSNWDDDTIKSLIESAVQYRKVSDVETGSYLSGGIDSSIIASLVNKEHTWTIGFDDFNEFEYAKEVADKYNFNHHEIMISRDEYKDIATDLINVRKEPLSVPNEVSILKMTQEVAKYNTVVLSGEGADELFFGYDRIFRWANENEFSIEGFDKMYSYGSHKDDEIIEYVLEPYKHLTNNLEKTAAFFQIDHLHGLLRRLDNSTMRCSVEARVPFVDHRVIEYMYGAPIDYRMRGGIVKEPLKRIFADILPESVINRKKVGFPVPVEDIFKSASSGVDGWLTFNLQTLLKDDWNKIKEMLKEEKINV